MSIKVLAEEVASQIAAGEVIERPASVVKELIENAIDAESTQITVRIEESGKKLIEISDDGCGIPADELETAVKRHATSKLRMAEDLFHITTLGFRGEALAAAGSVSRMSITSKTADADEGRRIVVEGGFVTSNKPFSARNGTIISIEDLFYNVPARLKFLKSDATERAQVETLISRYALAYSSIRWQLQSGSKTLLQTTGNGNYREILSAIYGLEMARQFIEIELDEGSVKVFGFISPTSLTRANRKEMNFFINGRWVQDQGLNSAVLRAYQSLIMVGRFPLTALFLSMEPEEVDVNVHPAKAEVRFRDPDKIFACVHRAVRRALMSQSPVPELNTAPVWPNDQKPAPAPFDPNMRDRPVALPLWRTSLEDHELPTGIAAEDSSINAAVSERVQTQAFQLPDIPENHSDVELQQQERRIASSPESVSPLSQTPIPSQVSESPTESLGPEPKTFVPVLHCIGQLGAAYILAEGPDGLYLIDQHAAHERVLFEKVMDLEASQTLPSQLLLEPEIVQLPPRQASCLEENLPFLQHIGFAIESFGPSAFRVTAVPFIFHHGNPSEALAAVAEDYEENEVPLQGMKEELAAKRVCKTMAVKAGQILSHAEQIALLRDLEQCRSPRTCPHGRPTMIHLSLGQLEKQFGRKGAL